MLYYCSTSQRTSAILPVVAAIRVHHHCARPGTIARTIIMIMITVIMIIILFSPSEFLTMCTRSVHKRHYCVYNCILNVKYLTKLNSFMRTTWSVFHFVFLVAYFSSMLAFTVKNIVNNQDDFLL